MKSLLSRLSSRPVLWFLFLFNVAVALAVGFEPVATGLGLDTLRQVVTSVFMGVIGLGAGASLLRRRTA